MCWRCGIDKIYLRHGWLDDPFHWHGDHLTISSFPNAVFDEIPLSYYRYCFMHCLANSASHAITNTHDLLPPHSEQRHTFHLIIQSICPKWYPTKPLLPKEMKAFFSHKTYLQLVPLFKPHERLHTLLWPTTPHSFHLTTSQAVHMLFDSYDTYYNFGYTVAPVPVDFHNIHAARNGILSCYHSWEVQLQPTTHYLTCHTILDAEKDGTTYFTIQEGVEHLNKMDKESYHHSFFGTKETTHHESSWQYLINQEQLRLYFTHHGYG